MSLPQNYQIARAGVRDVPKILGLFDAYRAFFAERIDDTSRRFLEDRLGRDESVIFAAWSGSEAAGFIQLYQLWSSWYCARIWFLSDLYVRESDRKRGVGASLVRHVVEYARETGAASIMVELPRREPQLAEFYASLGFSRDEIFELARLRLR